MAGYHDYATFKQKVLFDGVRVVGRIAFEYVNGEGVATHRVVDTEAAFENSVGHYCLGHCFLRGAVRTFDSSRSSYVWDVGRSLWFRDLRDWARGAPRSGPLMAPPVQAELQALAARPRPATSDVASLDDAAAQRDVDELGERCRATSRWLIERAQTSRGELCLKLSPEALSRAKPLSIWYTPAVEVERRRLEASPPQWAVDGMAWRVSPRWPQPTRGYSSFAAVLDTLVSRRVLSLD